MSDAPAAVLGRRTLYRGWMSLEILRLRLNGEAVERPLLDHPSGSAVLVYDPDRRVAIVVRQVRAGPLLLDLPAPPEAVAGVAEDADFAACACREVLEETGIRIAEPELVARVWMTPGSTTERVHLFLARFTPADRVALGGGLASEGERVLCEEVALDQLWAQAQEAMTDAKMLILLQALRIRRPDLFAAADA